MAELHMNGGGGVLAMAGVLHMNDLNESVQSVPCTAAFWFKLMSQPASSQPASPGFLVAALTSVFAYCWQFWTLASRSPIPVPSAPFLVAGLPLPAFCSCCRRARAARAENTLAILRWRRLILRQRLRKQWAAAGQVLQAVRAARR